MLHPRQFMMYYLNSRNFTYTVLSLAWYQYLRSMLEFSRKSTISHDSFEQCLNYNLFLEFLFKIFAI